MKPTWYRRVIAALAVCIAAGGSIGLAWRTIAAPAPVQPIRIATMEWPGYYSIMRADKEGRLAPVPATLIIKPDIASMIGAFSRHEADVIPFSVMRSCWLLMA